METSNIELGNFMFKLHELSDGDKRRALVLPLHKPNLNQRSPFSALNPQSEPRVVKYFQPESGNLNINGTRGRVHYDNSAQLHELSACLSPLRPARRGSVSRGSARRTVPSSPATESRLASSRHRSRSINYRQHFRMTNDLYLSPHRSMASLPLS